MVGTLGKIALYGLAGYAAFTLAKGCASEGKKELSVAPEYKTMELYSSNASNLGNDVGRLASPREANGNPYMNLERKL